MRINLTLYRRITGVEARGFAMLIDKLDTAIDEPDPFIKQRYLPLEFARHPEIVAVQKRNIFPPSVFYPLISRNSLALIFLIDDANHIRGFLL